MPCSSLPDRRRWASRRSLRSTRDAATSSSASRTAPGLRATPQTYAIQNDTCPVVAGAPVDPALFAVHDGKIYAFASAECVQLFKDHPRAYLKP